MMEITSRGPAPNHCADPNCHHTRRKHLHKTYENGKLQTYHYGACRALAVVAAWASVNL